MDDGETTHNPITPYRRSVDLNRALRGIEHVVKLHERDGKLPQDVDEGTVEIAKRTISELKATDVAALMLTENVPGDVALVMWNRARRALYALAPVVVMRLADKLDNAQAPGSERILSEVARGLGLLVPGEPLKATGREDEIRREDLADMTDDELDRRLKEMRRAKEE